MRYLTPILFALLAACAVDDGGSTFVDAGLDVGAEVAAVSCYYCDDTSALVLCDTPGFLLCPDNSRPDVCFRPQFAASLCVGAGHTCAEPSPVYLCE